MTDDKLISAAALLEKVQFRIPARNGVGSTIKSVVEITRKLIEEAPSAVIRCTDCRYWHRVGECGGPSNAQWGHCNWFHSGRVVYSDDFCSNGVRKVTGSSNAD